MKDLIDRAMAIDAIHEDADWLASQGSDWQVERMERDKSILRSLPSAHPSSSCVRENDTISRRMAIDAIVNTVSEIGLHDNSEVARYGATFRQHEIIDIIEGMPSAQSERKRGRWIYGEDNPGTGRDGWFCSECEHFEMWDYSADMKSAELNLPNYCPNCGADMREVDDERPD